MSKVGFQAFAAGMIVATSLLGGTYFLSDKQSASADIEKKEVSESEVESFLTSNGRISIPTDEYEELLAVKDKALKQPVEQPEKVEEKQEEVVKYTVKVTAGMSTYEISNVLEQNGIISDSFAFDQYLIKHDFHRKIQLGSFEVRKGMDFYQLAHILTD
ncbi:hypothetical protein [Metabacillus rhizolycopersici]|uniref:Endolytic transglycosylase MltG n=1 Tax=Metabacillus rhizolycopersici TaxID=2875709 RepID=A0ABS7UNX3_9BACI|nr:hypothetical protein [Metabacillus rhizolycopersici]MBZ5749747.1 hypothetical protein [Metabacillus rhizolycopersici]